MTSLLDILKEADLSIGFTGTFTTAASRAATDRAEVQRRLLLCLYGLGTNAGLKRLSSGRHGFSYKELLHTRRRSRAGRTGMAATDDRSRHPRPEPARLSHISLYGVFELDMDRRLDLDLREAA